MLAMKPNCELCDKDLAANATDAMICSYECTFCASCVEASLKNVCPNCGGGLVTRPIRPSKEWRPGVSATHQLPSQDRMHMKRSPEEQQELTERLKDVPPAER